jgi:hypothetical protein
VLAGALGGCVAPAPERVAEETVYYAPEGPPPLRDEIIAVPPGPVERFVWRPGHWAWNGRAYVWRPGEYVERPHRLAEWVPGHWVERRWGWAWVPGHWT